MQRSRPRIAFLGLMVAAWLAATADAPLAMFDALFAGERLRVPLADLAERVPLAGDQDVRIEELGRSEHVSQHVGAIRGAERPHRHDRHDQLVVMLRGHGTMRVGDETLPVGEGSVLFVPKGVVHAFSNAGPEPAVSLIVYSPPFDGKDRIQVP